MSELVEQAKVNINTDNPLLFGIISFFGMIDNAKNIVDSPYSCYYSWRWICRITNICSI